MVSTRLASISGPLGFDAPEQRNRVDPAKLLGLIHRIKSASGAASAPLMATNAKPAVKAG